MADQRAFRLCVWLSGVALLLFVLVVSFYQIDTSERSGSLLPPVLDMQFNGTPQDVRALFGMPGSQVRAERQAAIVKGTLADYGFMVFYGLALASYFRAQAFKTGISAWWAVVPLAGVAVGFDVLENRVFSQIAAAPEQLGLDRLLRELSLFAWGKWSILAVISALGGLAFFVRGAFALGLLCVPALFLILPSYLGSNNYGIYIFSSIGLSWLVMLSHAIKRAYFHSA